MLSLASRYLSCPDGGRWLGWLRQNALHSSYRDVQVAVKSVQCRFAVIVYLNQKSIDSHCSFAGFLQPVAYESYRTLKVFRNGIE